MAHLAVCSVDGDGSVQSAPLVSSEESLSFVHRLLGHVTFFLGLVDLMRSMKAMERQCSVRLFAIPKFSCTWNIL